MRNLLTLSSGLALLVSATCDGSGTGSQARPRGRLRELRDLRRLRVAVIPIRRHDFEEDRHTLGELAEAVVQEGHLVHGR
jgi:hypothetical protein